MAATQADLLARHAAASPEKTAVVEDRPDGGVITHTFAELDRRAGRIADLLCELGAVDTTRVAWCGPNSAGLLAVIGGIRRVGAVAVPLNYHLTPAEARYVLDNSDVEVVCVDAEHTDLVERVLPDTPRVRAVVTFDDDAPRVRVVRPGPALAHTDGFRGGDIFYTSGTTGRPKGVVRPPAPDPGRSPLAVLIGYRPDDVYLTTGPLYHSGPARFAAMAQALGNTVVVQRKFHAEDWLRLVDRYGVTATFSAPTPLRRVCGLPEATKGRYDRSRMRRFVANAAPWSQALKRAYLADFPADSLWEVYGSAEFGVAAVLPPADQLRKPGSCGLPAPGVDVALFTDDGHEVTVPHQRGELFVRSPSMFHAYYKAAEQYEIDRRGEYHSVGDVAYRDGDGYLYIADRKKDIIISGGVNIYPAEVEAALDQSPDIYEVAVFGVPDEHWGESVHAAVVPARPGVTVAEVIDFARAHLAGYKLPRTVTFLGELPKTGSGKVLKRALRARLGGDGDPC